MSSALSSCGRGWTGPRVSTATQEVVRKRGPTDRPTDRPRKTKRANQTNRRHQSLRDTDSSSTCVQWLGIVWIRSADKPATSLPHRRVWRLSFTFVAKVFADVTFLRRRATSHTPDKLGGAQHVASMYSFWISGLLRALLVAVAKLAGKGGRGLGEEALSSFRAGPSCRAGRS